MPHYIITEHVAKLAKRAIESFRETCPDCIIVSCDDQSPYNDTEFLEEMSDVYIRNAKNLGFAANCNVGFKWILENEKEECNIVCANNDIEVYPNWLKYLEEAMDFCKGVMVGGLGYKARIVEGMPISEYETNPGSKFTSRYYSDGGRLEDWMFPGGFYMARKSTFEKHGLYDENFEHGGYEDIDLFMRIQEAGDKLVMTPKVSYWHEEGATRFSEQERGTQDIAEVKNRQYFRDKWGFDAHEEMNQRLVDNRINL